MADPSRDDVFRLMTLGLMISAGAIALACITAAAQLWEFPYARALTLGLLANSAIMASSAAGFHLIFVLDKAGTNRPWGRRAATSLASLILLFVGAYGTVNASGFISAILSCSWAESALCNLKVDKVEPSQLREIDNAIYRAKRRMYFWE